MKLKKLIPTGCAFLTVFLYFYHSEIIISAVKEALFLCYDTVIPSLFLFIVFSCFVSGLKNIDLISIPFTPFLRILNISNRRIITYIVLSIFGGFATGGYFLNRINEEFDCDENMSKVLTVLLSGNSPSFVITAVGAKLLGNIKTGVMLYIALLLSAYMTAFLLSFIFPYNHIQTLKADFDTENSFILAIKQSVTAIINICGIVIVAYSICKVFSLYINNYVVLYTLSAFSEVTTACFYVNQHCADNLYLYCICLCVLPLSSALQIKSFINDSYLNLLPLYISKLFQLPVAVCVLRILINIFPVTASVYASRDIRVNMYWNSPHISFYMFLLSVCFVVLFDKKAKVFTKFNK